MEGKAEGKVHVEHHTNVPVTDGSKCLICLEPLTLPYLVINLGPTFQIKADDSCWSQLNGMADILIQHDEEKRKAMN